MFELSSVIAAIDQFFKSPERDSVRLFHGRGGRFPGLEWCAIDAFAPTILITLFSPPPEDVLWRIRKHIEGQLPNDLFTHLAIQHRYMDNAPFEWAVGNPLEEGFAQRGNARFHLRYSRQNIGYFLDMEPGRQWLEQHANGASVLNLFSYTCAFSVVAQAAGALSVVNVDMSKAALSLGRENHRVNELDTQHIQFMPLDILKSWSRIKKPGPYNIVIIDPPSFQRGSFVAEKDYVKIIRRLPELVAEGGDVLACLNAPELDAEFLQTLFSENAPEFQFVERLGFAEAFLDVDERRQLKLLHFNLRP